ncbi:uncharacterized protein C20orf96 [Nematostella vectensis]|uniref:uncharacterized protein C20orf96 n=1 Tax=Nematostella vectensis TaxID=45351 RepID=UPI00207703DD|nr:uncharacterized protein C20orf96 [Nematostella vectensis]
MASSRASISSTPKKASITPDSTGVGQKGWGKQATQRLYTKEIFSNDPLLKSLEGKIAVGFGDYKPWQRTSLPRNRPLLPSRETPVQKRTPSRPISGWNTVSALSRTPGSRAGGITVGERPYSAATQRTNCSSVCAHPWTKKPPPVDDGAFKRHLKLISILEVQIKTRERSIEDYQQRKKELLKDNIDLKSQIEGSEQYVHNDVKELLKKYDRFRGALSTLNKTFEDDLVNARKQLSSAKLKVDKDIAELQYQLNLLDAKVQKKLEEVKVLLNYKDKEYPVKALMIAKLKRKKEILNTAFKEELEELQAVIDTETSKFSEGRRIAKDTIKANITEETIQSMNKNIQDMALQNMIMKKEIEIHKKEVELVEKHNEEMENEISQLLESPELDTKAQMFPGVFSQREKCTPGMDIVLDIPVQEWLPI